jgi:2-succinyl-5-enolpyruvyl-6-hydroxy-3-cyclohexene-1-carboxylate synthase
VVCVNNDGGGIFQFLPIAQQTDRFEELFATPRPGPGRAPASCRAEFCRVSDGRALRAALQREGPGLRIVEARTGRAANVAQHRALQAAWSRRWETRREDAGPARLRRQRRAG